MREWQELIEKIKIGGPLPVTFDVRPTEWGELAVTANMASWSREYPKRPMFGRGDTTVNVQEYVSGPPDPRFIRYLAQRLYKHELDEFMLVDGVRLFDPHKDER